MSDLSLLIADDHLLVREALAHFLAAEPGIRIEMADSLPDALRAVAKHGPFDVVLLDVMMPGMDGIDSVARAVAANAGGAVVIFSGAVRRAFVDEAIGRGARGYVPKNLPANALIHALRQVASGRIFLPMSHLTDEAADFPQELRHLSPQEGRVLLYLCEGKSNKEIARAMELSEVTIKTHMRAICAKLDARNRTHAAMIANAHLRR